jgi:hypothetical protein
VGVAADPTDGNTIYVAAAGGGAWKTSNGGSTWTPLTDTQSTLFMGSIAVAAGSDINHRIVYAGTGEANFSGVDTFYGRGVLVSRDSGATWTLTGNSIFNRLAIGKVLIDPTDTTGNTAYAAVSGAPNNGFGNGSGGGNWGIWKTTNGGSTWTNTTTAVVSPLGVNPFTDLIMDPQNHNTLYAAVGSPRGGAANGVYKTTNGGTSWTPTTFPGGTGTGRITLAIAANSTTLYASVSDPTSGNFGATLEIEQSINSGATWTAVMTESSFNYIDYMGDQGWYDQAFAVDPSDPMGNTVYAAGQADLTLYPLDSVIESSDGGVTWTDITQGIDGSEPHVDNHAMAFDAAGKLLDGNDGGLWRLANANVANTQWTDLNGNLNITELEGAALDPTTAAVAYGGSQDNGTFKFTGTTDWNEVFGGDGGYVRVDPNNHLTVYTENNGISLARSDDGGNTWNSVSTGISGSAPPDGEAGKLSFYIPYVLDPANTSRVVLGTTDINESLNKGNSWSTIAVPGVGGYIPGNDRSGTVAGVTALATRGNTVYAASSDGRVWVTANDGLSWTESDPMPPSSFVGKTFIPGGYKDIEIDQSDTTGNTAYIVTAEFEADISGTSSSPHHVFKTINGGATWTDISGNLPDLPTWSIAIDHADNTLYVGTDNGVYVSTNGGTTWSVAGSGMPNVQVVSLEFNSGLQVLGAGTHGRGYWELSTAPPPTLTSISPNSGPSTGGPVVTITGTSFGTSSTVKFGAVPAITVSVLSPTTLVAVAPAEAADTTVDVTVTTLSGTSPTSPADQFTFYGPLAKYIVAVVGSSTVQAGSNFLLTVQAADAAGTPVANYSGPSTVTASISPTAAGSFPVTVSLNSSGFGFFQGNIQLAGSYTLTATGGSITGSTAVTVVAAAPAMLAFAGEPVNTPTDMTLATVTVQVQDAVGNVITTDNSDVVTISIGSGPGGLVPGSTTSATAVSGVASFSNLKFVVPGSYTLNAVVLPGKLIGLSSNPFSIQPLQVMASSFVGTPSGFALQFNAPYLINSLTPVLYGQGFGAAAPAPSVIVTTDPANLNDMAAYATGSLALNPATNSMTWLVTDTASLVANGTPVLRDGIYTVIVRSRGATDGFQALLSGGGFLDGLGTGTPGSGDFRATFTVTAKAAGEDIVWIPAVSEGPGQPLNGPGKNLAGGGYPIYLDSSTASITSVQLTLDYNPALLGVTGATGAGFSLLGSSTPGHADLQYSGPALAAGTKTPIGFLTATVSSGTAANPVPYKMKDVLHLSDVMLNGGAVTTVATGDALHMVSYVADADGSGSYSANDAVLITRALLNTDTGFAAYPLVDPVIIADTDGSGFIPADSAFQANEASVGLPTANLSVPPIPAGVTFQVIGNNVDPALSVPAHLQVSAAGSVTVPVNIDDGHPAGSSGLIKAQLALTYDPRVFTVSAADVHLGSLLAGSGWSIVSIIDPTTGQIAIALSGTTPITSSAGGSLVTIDFHQRPGEPGASVSGGALLPAPPGANVPGSPVQIALVGAVNVNGQYFRTELQDAQGSFTLSFPLWESTVTLIGHDSST